MKMIQNMKDKIKLLKKNQTIEELEMKYLGAWTGTLEANLTNRVQGLELRISGIDNTVAENNTLVQEIVKHNKIQAQPSRKSGTLLRDII